jgi:hypothetical protein
LQDRLVQKVNKLFLSLAILVSFYFDNATSEQKHVCQPWGRPLEQKHSHEITRIDRNKGDLVPAVAKVILDYEKYLHN